MECLVLKKNKLKNSKGIATEAYFLIVSITKRVPLRRFNDFEKKYYTVRGGGETISKKTLE
jgi:hypothetical protein